MAGLIENDTSRVNDDNNEDDSNVITMVDVLAEEEKLEEDAFAVLGASDDKNCTYSQGYMKRQALYACKTCFDSNNKLAGVCLACSYHCHEGHDLVELYTKRNFRCDCGNSLFGDKKCNLEPNKEDANIGNHYNQNFKGVYCSCARPYPDPEDNTMDEMIQCIICEDWYHTRHLDGALLPGANDYSEMICHSCTSKLGFLDFYAGHSVTKIKPENLVDDKATVEVDVITAANENSKDEQNHEKVISTTTVAEDQSSISVAVDNTTSECKLKSLSAAVKVSSHNISDGIRSASFWREGFRNILCKCSSCLDLYKSHGVSFLVDPLDTVQAYEEEGETKLNRSRTGYEQGLKALSSLDRIKQIEAIHRYNEMQEHLKAYLAKFAENKKVVRPEDIKEFFSEMESRKRQKVEVPYFCH
ncbi:putative E3 ubiquitin-protein ligase UBR7 [Lycorma delicatula]|uniref:putative E3 ubiquitin-protein ligase UBR7 n=1 Tax=Lycorma delicatula TaxID=130591 RepID=UPI003F517751